MAAWWGALHADGRATHFAPIVASGGLLDLVSDFIGELKRLEIWPEHFRDACLRRGIAPKDEELLAFTKRIKRASAPITFTTSRGVSGRPATG